jgi:eukaryotic-like serine/threonine-protein kinase
MTRSERWIQIDAVLEAALETSPSQRTRLLDRLCGDDAALRGEVESLLAADAAAGSFLEASAAYVAAPYLAELPEALNADRAGLIIGRYRILEEIGRGGMGTVWLAERADGHFEQRVALKLIKRGMDSDEILARFLRERQILARLEHPNIARLLDGGVSEDGRPYFVMEHVPGVPITRYCDDLSLPVEARLRLFAVACRAVQYAHRNLVVHRDLKPSNVLVTEAGEVKLLDFGVAKLLRDDSSAEVTTGAAAGRPMTPEYASPEQAAGAPVTTASDVYQLGILLYELLTGRRPYGVTGRSAQEIERNVRESEPSYPSVVVGRVGKLVHRDGRTDTIEPARVSGSRRTTTERLRRRLRGDLDGITLRTLRKEPERRYPSAEDLAEDVERHLAHQPLRFGGELWSYRTLKFVRRYRTRLAVAGVVLLAGAGFGATYVLRIREERDRARREESKAAEGAALLRRFFQGWSPDAADRGEVSATTVLADAAHRAETELGRDPLTLASVLSMLGDLYGAIGRRASADSLLTRALRLQERTPGATASDIAATLGRRGRLLLANGRPGEGETILRRALALYRAALPADRTQVLLVQNDLALTLSSQETLPEAEALLRDMLRKLPQETTPLGTEVAASLGYVLFQEARYEESAAILRTALESQRRLFGRIHYSTLKTVRFLASALRDLGVLDEAEALNREALEISRILFGADHAETIASLLPLAIVLERKGNFAEAELVSRTMLERIERHYGVGDFRTANVLRTLGSIRLARGDVSEAAVLLRRGLTAFRAGFPPGHPDEGDILNRLVFCLIAEGAPDARQLYREAIAFENARPKDGPFFVTDGYEFLAESARRMGDRALAERLFRRAIALDERQLPAGHPYRSAAAAGLRQTLADVARGGTPPLR